MTVVACKYVHRSLVQYRSVVSAGTWRGAFCLYSLPEFLVEVEVEQVIKVLPSLPLITSKEKKSIHKKDAASPASGRRQFALGFYFCPLVLPYAIGVNVIESFLVVGSPEQVDVPICKNAFVACPRSED